MIFILSCEDKVEKDSTPPTVSITSPQDGSTVSKTVTIICESTDNDRVEKVELWINGDSTNISDNTEPYALDWNTTENDDGYIITGFTTFFGKGESDFLLIKTDLEGNTVPESEWK